MEKKDLKPIKEKKFDKYKPKYLKIKKKKYRRYAKILYFRACLKKKLRRIRRTKYIVVYKFFDFFKKLIFKKEFFIFKNFFLKFKLKINSNVLLFPHFVFEKQFLFKFGEYQTVITDLTNSSIFLKKKYGFLNNPGLNY
ncbi:hypothetical protein [Thauera sp.]|uniref:hypothetical protein n=1 Tax=Thauera sp. TaxID=1905334 RepID=UPI002CABF86B|nr:hypothetical protein [Thauera sp.]HRP26163.1 hypothetical protein [Thauera sp.]